MQSQFDKAIAIIEEAKLKIAKLNLTGQARKALAEDLDHIQGWTIPQQEKLHSKAPLKNEQLWREWRERQPR